MQLILYPNTEQQKKITVSTDGATIGKSADSTIVLSGVGIADYHARLQYTNGKWYVIDISCRGDVSVDGVTNTKLLIQVGSSILIDGHELFITSLGKEENDYLPKTTNYNGADIVHDLTVTKQCPQCGFLSHEGSHFCPRCGYSFNVDVSDGALTDSEAITITVGEVNEAPSYLKYNLIIIR